MLKTVDLSLKLPQEGYAARLRACQEQLHARQQEYLRRATPILLVFEGWEGAGQAELIAGVTRRLESHNLHQHDIQPPRTYETHLPWLWRFWLQIPRYGDIAIFNRSWYTQIVAERVARGQGRSNWRKAYRDVVNFERALAQDGYVICKFFLHVSEKWQHKRFKQLEKDPLEGWRIEAEHWERHRQYAPYTAAYTEMLQRTHTDWAPWVVVEAQQRRWAQIKVLDTLLARLEIEAPEAVSC